MMGPRVLFIDTSVFCHIIAVPSKTTPEESAAFQEEFARRHDAGVRFVLPITTIVETGNFVQQCANDRYAATQRFHKALELAARADPPWVVHDLDWNAAFLQELLAGNSTGYFSAGPLHRADSGSRRPDNLGGARPLRQEAVFRFGGHLDH